MSPSIKTIKSNRGLMIIIAFLCFFPMVLASFFYFSDYHFDFLGKKNYGELLKPARPFASFQLRHPNGVPFLLKEFEGRWALLFAMPASCDQRCQKKIFQIQQMQIALGKYQDRLLKFVVVSEREPLPLSDKYNIQEEAVLIGFDSTLWKEGQLYLMDPSGALILSYPPQFEGTKVLNDLRHLIKLSSTSR